MADKPSEILLFEFLTERIKAAASGDVLFEIELHDTVWQSITRESGIRISDVICEMAPEPGGGMKEWDVHIELACFAKVEGNDKKQRQPAMLRAFQLQQAVCKLLVQYQDLNGRVCDVLVRRGSRGYDTFDSNPYAVGSVPLVINPSGKSY